MRTVTITYGRTIEVGRFGHGRPNGRVWFGWEVEREEGEDSDLILDALRAKADEVERIEKAKFNERHGYAPDHDW